MGDNKILALVPKGLKRIIIRSTRAGRVQDIKKLNSSLQQNTDLVAKEYKNLDLIEEQVASVLEQLKKEDFKDEMAEIDLMDNITEEEREKLKFSLMEIKEKGLKELEPIASTSQKIKGHMLVTLNKAQVQRAILQAKTDLASNAHLQVETLQVINEETADINKDLEKLINDLDAMNTKAISDYSSFAKETKEVIEGIPRDESSEGEKTSSVDVIEKIIDKGKLLNKSKEDLAKAKREKADKNKE